MKENTCDNLKRLTINVRGQVVQLEEIICKKIPCGLLARLSEDHPNYIPSEKVYYFNRDPVLFNCVINYYVNGVLHVPSNTCSGHVQVELEFWGLGLDHLADCCWARLTESLATKRRLEELIRTFQSDKGNNSKVTPSKDNENCSSDDSKDESIRDKIFCTLEYPSYSRVALAYAATQFVILVVSILAMVALSDPRVMLPDTDATTLRQQMAAANLTEAYTQLYLISRAGQIPLALRIIEYISIGAMTLDLIIRFITCRDKKLMISVYTVFDLLATVPCFFLFGYFYLVVANDDTLDVTSTQVLIVEIFNALRILRVLRLLKLGKQVQVVQVLLMSLGASKRELLLLTGIVAYLGVIFGCFIYKLEMFENTFESMGHGIWWAVVTMTTLGYGDYYPTGAFGCILGAFAALTGILVLALPIPVIANNFDKYYSMFQLMNLLRERQRQKWVHDMATGKNDEEIKCHIGSSTEGQCGEDTAEKNKITSEIVTQDNYDTANYMK